MGRVHNRASGSRLTGDVCHQGEAVAVELLGGTLSGDPTTFDGDGELALTIVDFLLCDEFADHVDSLSEDVLT